VNPTKTGAALLAALTIPAIASDAATADGATPPQTPLRRLPVAPAVTLHRETIALQRKRVASLRRDIRGARRTAVRRARALGRDLHPRRPERGSNDVRDLRRLREYWRSRARALGSRIERTSTAATTGALVCIHRYEGAWNANTGNGYYGGLQMDLAFQQAYGPEFLATYGTADRWPAWAQLAAGTRAVAERGWTPWPSTAAMCGVA
jgi:hypothetical protein